MIAAITSLEGLKKSDKIPNNYLKLEKEKYPMVLDKDCYVNLDQIVTVDGENLKKLERYGKTLNATLDYIDLEKLDYKLALTYELQSFVNKENNEAIRAEMSNLVQYIDEDIRRKVDRIIAILNDEIAISLLKELIDKDLIEEIRNTYKTEIK